MPKSLIAQLPEIVAEGRRTAEKILEGLEGRHRVSLHTRELVLRKRTSALAWCERINALSETQRQSPPWHYVLLGQDAVEEWQAKGAHLAELLAYARLRPRGDALLQGRLEF